MFDFEKLVVYQKSELFCCEILNEIIKKSNADKIIKDQLRRASTSISLNIAEGCGRVSKKDRCNFYVIARGSTFECISILKLLKSEKLIDDNLFLKLYSLGEEIVKMLIGLDKSLR